MSILHSFILFCGISFLSSASASIQETKYYARNIVFRKTGLIEFEKSSTKTEISVYPPRKKRRGSPYRSGTGGKKWGGKVGACAKKRRR
ncbi:MAG TPA: hypothetical protein DEF82_02940 [Crocinitomicaceae bacterium]|nr:hypothetical protein [Flavobacteriales bacterium]HBW85716.1 hypothetical protein [Crocinitomicaceae bacterium]